MYNRHLEFHSRCKDRAAHDPAPCFRAAQFRAAQYRTECFNAAAGRYAVLKRSARY